MTDGSEAPTGGLSRDGFLRRLAAFFEVEVGAGVAPGTGLFDEWALDSLQALQLVIAVESWAGVDVPPEELPMILTVDDAYAYYLALRRPDPSV